ncbi:hypothetical protein KKF34_14745 [Myxococcota bacterium]|nr:hypothetical protein [Myxococcota bacterium]MBU1382131.1 hypothetical protein [Myxococcota bacterium]MBU1498133.1 hypothetical protein [Myxococcota bacterium]
MHYKLLFLLSVSLFFIISCDETTSEAPDRLLDGPIQSVFFCTTTDASGNQQYLSATECSTSDENTVKYALTLASTRGELALVSLSSEKFIDLDKYQPGYNFIPVGKPVSGMVINEDTGVVSILGSEPAKITKVNIEDIVQFLNGNSTSIPTVTSNFATTSGFLRANATSIEMLPSSENFLAVMPRCGAVVALSGDATVLNALRMEDATSLSVVTGDFQCPAEGAPIENEAPSSEETFSRFPTTLLSSDGYVYMAFYDGSDASVFQVELDSAGAILNTTPITLEGNTGGIARMRMSPQTRWGKFLYLITRAGDVRVVRVDDLTECDTNVETGALGNISIDDPNRGCVPVGLMPRNHISTAPGIRPGRNQIAVDVAFFEDEVTSDLDSKTTLNGIFAFILTMNGNLYVTNLDETFSETLYSYRLTDDNEVFYPAEVMAHRLRNLTAVESNGFETTGRPRVTNDPYYRVDGYSIIPDDRPAMVIENDSLVSDIEQYMSRNETWSFVWQGTIPDTARSSGIVPEDDSFLELYDPGTSFCEKDIRPGDVVTFAGCYDSDDCDPGFQCLRTPLQSYDTNGMCFPEDSSIDYSNVCRKLLASDREYLITEVYSDSLTLELNYLHETIDSTALVSCESNIDCTRLTDRGGGVCTEINGQKYCVSAPIPLESVGMDVEKWCLTGFQPYNIRTGNEFFVYSSSTPYVFETSTNSGMQCVYEGPSQNRFAPVNGIVELPFFKFNMTFNPSRLIEWKYSISFEMEGAFSYFVGDMGARFPASISYGPDGNFYISDAGDTGSSGTTVGQLIRLVPDDFYIDSDFIIR